MESAVTDQLAKLYQANKAANDNLVDEIDSEEDERDKKFAPPPSYFYNFSAGIQAMAPPDLECL